jgi:hypothetical protein
LPIKTTIVTRPAPERAFLVAVAGKSGAERWSAEDSLDEMAQLARASWKS